MPKRPTTQHPGTVLLHEFMKPHNLSAAVLAHALKISRQRVHYLIAGKRAVTADTALRLARFFNTTPKFWMDLQIDYDLGQAEAISRKTIDKEVQPIIKLPPQEAQFESKPLTEEEEKVYNLLSTDSEVSFDALVNRSRMSASALAGTLTMLELAGLAKCVPGERYVKILRKET